tara:strand:+ start:17025 stop:17351 length:327 start_codon:yes stop_codon:yes gene_type:complete
MATTKTSAANEAATQEKTAENDPNKVVLLGSISYNDEKEYTEWLANMDVSQAIFVMVASANYAQSKGLYNLAESELISSAIRAIKNGSTEATVESGSNKKSKAKVEKK